MTTRNTKPTQDTEIVLDGNLEVATGATATQLVEAEKARTAKPKATKPVTTKSVAKDAAKKVAAKGDKVTTKANTVDEKKPKTVAEHMAVLTADKAIEICKLADTGMKPSQIAKQFGVAASHVSNIVRGVTWQEATGRHYQGPGKKWGTEPWLGTDAAKEHYANRQASKKAE